MGRSVAIQLARKGANVVIIARNVEKLDAALKDISVCINPSSTINLHS